MAELLLELLSEEIPARMQARAAQDLQKLVEGGLNKAGLSWGTSNAYVTPRRLCLVIDGLPEKQPDVREEKKGPQTSAPEQALKGFLGSLGGLSIDDCEQREIKGKTFYFAVIEKKGEPTSDVLAGILNAAFDALSWPKSMRWGRSNKRWVRPLHNILAIFNGDVVDVAFEHIKANNQTKGHRFLSPNAIAVTDFSNYQAKLKHAYVMLDPADRRALIMNQAEKLATHAGLVVRTDDGLLNEVSGLVEWPTVLMGNVDERFMQLPPEVLTDTLKVHQKYFTLLKADGSLAPHFLTVSNQVAPDDGKAITAGNERVLRARLSDAKFFWDQDRKVTLESRLAELDKIVFHEKLGSVGAKVLRLQNLAGHLAQFTGADRTQSERAAKLCKCDLVTGMVFEIPEVQGVMGRYYALHDGEPENVANALAEHYSPLGPNDDCPTAPVAVALALADKIDTLVGFWTIDEKPTGSKDPFALRRAALGVIRLIVENGLRLPLLEVFAAARQSFPVELRERETENKKPRSNVEDEVIGSYHDIVHCTDLLAFFADRLKVHLKAEGVRHDLIDAVTALGDEDDLVRLLARVEALSSLVGSDDGINLLAAHKRAANILSIEQKKEGVSYSEAPNADLFDQDEERVLFDALNEVGAQAKVLIGEEKFASAMTVLAQLRPPLDQFFEGVMVNTDDEKVRANRLKLLSQILAVMGQIADFSKIVS